MSASMVGLILNLILLGAVGFGFLFGALRGAKKSGIRTIWLVVFLGVGFLVSPLISKAIINIQISPTQGTIGQLIEAEIMNIPEIADIYADNAALQDLVAGLPAAIINLAVFMVLIPVAMGISYVAYAINKAILKRKNKNQIQEKQYTVQNGRPVVINNPKPKKHRIWGGVIGAVGGFVICFCLFLPINGAVHTIKQYIDPNPVASAQTTESTFEYAEISKMLTENLGQDVVNIIKAVDGTVLSKISGVGNIDLALFDAISTTKVGGETISLRKELNTLANVGETVLYIQNSTDESGNINFQNLNFDKLETTVDAVFESGLVKVVGIELLQAYLDKAVNGTLLADMVSSGQLDQKTADFVKEILAQVWASMQAGDGKLATHLHSDCIALLGVAKSAIESGLVGEITANQTHTEKEWFEIAQSCLYGTHENSLTANHNYLQDIINHLFESSSLKAAIVGAVNIGLNEITTWLDTTLSNQGVDTTANPVVFDRLTQENIDWNSVEETFLHLVEDVIVVADFAITNNFVEGEIDIKSLINHEKFDATALALANALDELQTSPLITNTLGGENVLNQAFDELARVEKFGKFVNLSALKNTDWNAEITALLQTAQFAKPAINAQNIKTFAFKDLDFATLQTNQTISNLFGGNLARAIKLDWVKTDKIYTNQSAEHKELFDIILQDATTLADLKTTAVALANAASLLGETGIVEIFMQGADAEKLNATATALVAKTDEKTLLKNALDTLFEDDKLCRAFVWVLNNMIIPTLEETAGDMGEIDVLAPEKLAAWKSSASDFESAITALLEVYLSLDIQTFEGISGDAASILKLVLNDDFETTNAQKIGVALDKLCTTSALATTQDKQVAKQYLYNALKEFEDVNASAILTGGTNFWTNELTNLAPSLMLLKNTYADSTQTTTLLDMVLAGDADKLIETTDFMALENEQIEELIFALQTSQLFEPVAEEIIDSIMAIQP